MACLTSHERMFTIKPERFGKGQHHLTAGGLHSSGLAWEVPDSWLQG